MSDIATVDWIGVESVPHLPRRFRNLISRRTIILHSFFGSCGGKFADGASSSGDSCRARRSAQSPIGKKPTLGMQIWFWGTVGKLNFPRPVAINAIPEIIPITVTGTTGRVTDHLTPITTGSDISSGSNNLVDCPPHTNSRGANCIIGQLGLRERLMWPEMKRTHIELGWLEAQAPWHAKIGVWNAGAYHQTALESIPFHYPRWIENSIRVTPIGLISPLAALA